MATEKLSIGHTVLAYRQTVRIHTAFCVARSAIWAASAGYKYTTWFHDHSGIEKARNRAVVLAMENGLDFLAMQDSDCAILNTEGGSLLGDNMAIMLEHNAAAVGSVFLCRGIDKMNCEPAKPNQVYEGRVGTGFMLIDLRKLRDMPMPWFAMRYDETHCETTKGEDMFFCDKVTEHGQSVWVNYQTPTTHAFEGFLRCQPREIAEGMESLVWIEGQPLTGRGLA